MVRTGKKFKKRSVKSVYTFGGETGEDIIGKGSNAPRKGDKKRRAMGLSRDQLVFDMPPPRVGTLFVVSHL